MPHLHFVLDAYDCVEEHGNNPMAIYELLNQVAYKLELKPVMPPFLVPYYYCKDSEDGGISAFLICEGGHITIHTFPYRSCYFADILTDNFFSKNEAEKLFTDYLKANKVVSEIVDRRMIYDTEDKKIDDKSDFGPHFMVEVSNVEMSLEWINKWLDNVAEEINMTPISRPYVIFDKKENPSYISGILVVAQSHIGVHYNIKEKKAYIDIFSCAFLDKEFVGKIFEKYFGKDVRWKLYSRGSKHTDFFKRKESRIRIGKDWQNNIK